MRKKITVVEDNNSQSELISLLLEDREVEITSANNIVDFYRIHHAKPDLIILDDHFRLGFNNQLYNTLKQNPLTKNIPVILMTDKESLDVRMNTGFDDNYIFKPFNAKSLIRTIAKSISIAV